MLILIDDEEMFRGALAANLRDDGYEVLEYASGLSVSLDRLAGVEALLIDYQLSGEDGLALADHFHRRLPHVRIILMSAFAPERLGTEVAARGYLTLLHKPLDYEELRALLEKPSGETA